MSANDFRTKKVFVGGLPQEANETSVREFFSSYGHVEEVLLMFDKLTSRMRGMLD
jgi:RNA recognition motif-containing protein